MDELCRGLDPRYHFPTNFDHDWRRIASGRALTEFSRSNSLISSLSIHLMSYVSHERTRPRSWTKVCPNQVWPWSEKNCTRESANRVWWTDAQTDRQTDRHGVFIALVAAAKSLVETNNLEIDTNFEVFKQRLSMCQSMRTWFKTYNPFSNSLQKFNMYFTCFSLNSYAVPYEEMNSLVSSVSRNWNSPFT